MFKTISIGKKKIFFVLSVFGVLLFFGHSSEALSRGIPTPSVIPLPTISLSSNPCPEIIPGNISICGKINTINVRRENGIEYAQESIKGATVAVYIGPGRFKFSDKNKTGEIVGKIEGLYMYNITNDDGRFIIAVPRGGLGGFVYLGFFCGDYVKDVYMLDASKTISFMPISLACPPEVTPSKQNIVPAPPNIIYFDRVSILSCEQSKTQGEGGMVLDATPSAVNLDLKAIHLDDTHRGALIDQWMCADAANPTSDPTGLITGCELVGDKNCDGIPPTYLDPPANKPWIDVPVMNTILSRRDLEGFTHSSMGYSMQAISSMNCGMGGCYNRGAPAKNSAEIKTLSRSTVVHCNTAWPIPVYCYGPAIGMATPNWYEASYNWNIHRMPVLGPQIYDNARLGSIVLPGHSKWLWPFTGSQAFPYSTVLNYDINRVLVNMFENRPANDSYENVTAPYNYCYSGEGPRQEYPAGLAIAGYPFKACYAAVLLGDDTYSTQKATWEMTNNTIPQITGSIYQSFLGGGTAPQGPPVANYYAPDEMIGVEASPRANARPNGIELIQRVGMGYWRIGVVNTLCTLGTPDYVSGKQYPVRAVFGTEGELHAKTLINAPIQ